MMNLIFRIVSWLREFGIILLTNALFEVWFTSIRFNRAITGIHMTRHDYQAFLCHLLVFSTYFISRFKPALTWKWAIAFSIAAPVFHAYVAWSLPLGDRTVIAHYSGVGGTTYDGSLNPGDGFLLSRVGMAVFAVGIFASMDGNSRIKYVFGTITGLIVVFLPIYTGLVFLPLAPLFVCLVGTVLGIRVGQLINPGKIRQTLPSNNS